MGSGLQTQQVLKAYNEAGKWDDIGNDKGITKIQIVSNPPLTSSLNSIFYATGDSEFVAKMKQEGKPGIKGSQGSELYEIYKGKVKVVEMSRVETIIPEPEPDQAPKLPDDGRPQPEKGAKKDPTTWKAVEMNEGPNLWKVVDDKDVNVADQFHSQKNAQQYIDYHKSVYVKYKEVESELVETGQVGGYLATNGVLQIYQNDKRIPLWVLGNGNWSDRASDDNASGNGNDTVITESGQVRYGVKCKIGAGDGTQDLGKALDQGYSDSEDDYESIEQTGYMQVTEKADDEDDQDVTWFGPSGRHPKLEENENDQPKGCSGCCYKGSLHSVTGKNRMAYEQWHKAGYRYIDWKKAEGTEEIIKSMVLDKKGKDKKDKGKRVGFKWVNMVIKTETEKYRSCEIWVDISRAIRYDESPGNEWLCARIQEDHNNWPESDGMKGCGCKNDNQAMIWKAPSVVYRWDNQECKLSLATVQEIKPPIPDKLHKEGDIVKPTKTD